MSGPFLTRALRHGAIAVMALTLCAGAAAPQTRAAQPAGEAGSPFVQTVDEAAGDVVKELGSAAIRLPVAAALGTILAFRFRRRGTPPRIPAVVETQIVLAIVGAVIMLVVGSSIARAFGIVGVASLIRYRSKIDDPKDAVVMLSALAVGLASGSGLYALATFSTLFLVGALWLLEGFETQRRRFELSIKAGDRTAERRPEIEAILRRFETETELRTLSEQEVIYLVTAPLSMETDRVSDYLASVAPPGQVAVEWREQSKMERAS